MLCWFCLGLQFWYWFVFDAFGVWCLQLRTGWRSWWNSRTGEVTVVAVLLMMNWLICGSWTATIEEKEAGLVFVTCWRTTRAAVGKRNPKPDWLMTAGLDEGVRKGAWWRRQGGRKAQSLVHASWYEQQHRKRSRRRHSWCWGEDICYRCFYHSDDYCRLRVEGREEGECWGLFGSLLGERKTWGEIEREEKKQRENGNWRICCCWA